MTDETDLDAWLAEHLMGWTWEEEFRGTYDGGGLEREEVWVRGWNTGKGQYKRFQPTTIIDHTKMIWEKMREKEMFVKIGVAVNDQWMCEFTTFDPDLKPIQKAVCYSDALEVAICLAAKAMLLEVNIVR